MLDPFAGAGSTLVAAAVTGRRYLGIELERQYCAIARDRLARISRRSGRSTEEVTSAEPRVESLSAVDLGGLLQWLYERDYHDLARTVRAAMEDYGR